MAAPSDIQTQLRSLAIPKDQRPVPETAGGGGARWWAAGLVVLIVLATTAYAFRQRIGASVQGVGGSSNGGSGARLFQVTAGGEPDPTAVLTATGKIVSDHRVSVATKVSGQIVALFFEQGDKVEKEQLLARVEDVLYRARRDEAAARLEKSIAHSEYQKVNFARVAGLVEQESAPSIEYADARRWLDETVAQVEADRALLAFAEKTLKDCEVLAPIAGVVLTRNVEVGDFVSAEGGRGANANARFTDVADMTKLRVEVDISELDIVRIRDEMPCLVTPDAYKDRKYAGQVMWLDPGANYSKATVQVKVRIQNPDDYLRVEGSAQVAFLSDKPRPLDPDAKKTSLWIPAAACLPGDGHQSATVFVAAEGRWKRTAVTLGRRSGDRVEVLGGLSVGQSIAVDGVDKITDGQTIRG